jgi:hypothetical protein
MGTTFIEDPCGGFNIYEVECDCEDDTHVP